MLGCLPRWIHACSAKTATPKSISHEAKNGKAQARSWIDRAEASSGDQPGAMASAQARTQLSRGALAR